MLISSYFIVTEPEKMGFPYMECMESALSFSDELVVVCGREEKQSEDKIRALGENVKIINTNAWPIDWEYYVMRNHLQIGLDACSGDFALKIDADHIFNKKFSKRIRDVFETHSRVHHISFGRVNYYSGMEGINRGFKYISSKTCYALNKSLLSEQNIQYEISNESGSNLPKFSDPVESFFVNDNTIWPINYDNTFMTKAQIVEKWIRFNNALNRKRGNADYFSFDGGDDVERPWREYMNYQKTKSNGVTFDDNLFHPEVIKNKINKG